MRKTRPATPKSRRSVLLAATCVALASSVYAWPFLIDDAFVTFRYARNLASGAGYAMNAGTATDGVTGPLWLVPLVLGHLGGASVPDLARLLGIAFSIGAFGITLWAMAGRFAGRSRELSALFLAFCGSYWVWAGGGLETGAATLALSVVLAAALRPLPAWAPLLALAALPSLRPELVPAALTLALGIRQVSRRALAAALLAGVALPTVWRFLMFGSLLPLSATAKSGSLLQGVTYSATSALLLTLGGALYLAWRTRRQKRARWLGLALGVHLVAVALVGGDWMPSHRLFVPLLPVLSVLTGWGAMNFPRATWVAAPTLAALAALSCFTLFEAREAGLRREARGTTLSEGLRGPVGLLDAGFLAWQSGVEVVDLGGITDPNVARMPGNHVDRRIDVAYLEARAPEMFVLHSRSEPRIVAGEVQNYSGYPTENLIVRLPWFRRHFRALGIHPYARDYWYVRFVRR